MWEKIGLARMAKQARISKNSKEENKRTGNGYKEHKNQKLSGIASSGVKKSKRLKEHKRTGMEGTSEN